MEKEIRLIERILSQSEDVTVNEEYGDYQECRVVKLSKIIEIYRSYFPKCIRELDNRVAVRLAKHEFGHLLSLEVKYDKRIHNNKYRLNRIITINLETQQDMFEHICQNMVTEFNTEVNQQIKNCNGISESNKKYMYLKTNN